MNRAQTARPPTIITRASLGQKLIGGCIVLIGVALGTPHEIFSAQQEISLHTGLLDTSSAVEPALSALRGKYAGRDFISTYGPLSQLIHGAWTASGPDDVSSVLRWNRFLSTSITNLMLWLALATTGAPLSWRAPAYLLWLILWPYSFIMPTLGFLVVILCGYLLGNAHEWNRIGAYISWALAAPVLLYQYFDLGAFTFAALILSVTVALAWTWGLSGSEVRGARRHLIGAGAAAGAGAALVASAAIVPNPFGDYLRDSWELAQGFSHTMASPIETRHLVVLAINALGSIVMGVYFGWRWRTSLLHEPRARGRALSLLAAACFCLVMTRYAVTRSDDGHMRLAVGSLVCLTGCFLPCYLRAASPDAKWPALLVWGPTAILASWFYLDHLATQINAILKWDPRPAELGVTHPNVREAIYAAKELPEDVLYVWPYESIVGSVAGKENPAFTQQAYAAHTPYLEDKTIAKLEEVPNAPVMYFVHTTPIDQVEHMTRTPKLFRFLLENYAMAGPRHDDFLLLRRLAGRKAQWHENKLVQLDQSFNPGHSEPLRVEFPPEVAAACRASDLIILRLSAANRSSLPLPKPGNWYLTLRLSNGTQRKRRILLPADGKLHDIIVSACGDEEPPFFSFFHPHRLWRSTTRVVGLELTWESMDWFSHRPAEATLHSIGTLRRTGAEVHLTGLAQASDPELWIWCYGEPARPFPLSP